MELPPRNGPPQPKLTALKRPQETLVQQGQNVFEIDVNNLGNAADLLKLVASMKEGEQLIITRKKQDSSLTDLSSDEISGPAETASAPMPEEVPAGVTAPVYVSFECRRNQQVFVETVLRELQERIGITRSPIDDLIDLFFCKKIEAKSKEIRLECDNPHIVYIFKKLEIKFWSLTFRNIGRSGCFHSKNDTVITEAALSSTWHRTRFDPPDANLIDAIFKKVEQICSDI